MPDRELQFRVAHLDCGSDASAVLTKTFRLHGIDRELASTLTVWGAIGGILGAKIYYAILFRDLSALFSRAGLVWYGGLMQRRASPPRVAAGAPTCHWPAFNVADSTICIGIGALLLASWRRPSALHEGVA